MNPTSPGEFWDQRFAQGWSSSPDESLIELASSLTPKRAIDLGCGTGRNALWLARQGWDVTGVDASGVGLAIAQEQAEAEHLVFHPIQADLNTFESAPASFDLVVIANIHLSPLERDALFSRAVHALAPGGHLYIVGHHVDAFGHHGPPIRENLYSEELFREIFLGFNFDLLERREQASDADGTPDVFMVFWGSKD